MSDPVVPSASAVPAGAKTSASVRPPLAGFVADLIIAIGVMLVASVAVFALYGAWLGFHHVRQGGDAAELVNEVFANPSPLLMIWVTLIGTGLAAVVPYWWRRRATVIERARAHAALRRPGTWAWIIASALAVFGLSAGVTALAASFGIAPEPTNQAPIRDALQAQPWFIGLFVVVIAPMYEELLFRRVLFGRFWAAGWPWLGMVLSSLAFALMHEPPGLTANSPSATLMLWTIYAGMGMVFAWLYRRTGTLWAPITAHALNNALALALLGAG